MAGSSQIVIAGAAGAWGDSALSTPQLLADGRPDYIIYEGLAEITMAILSRAKAADPGQGYARDIVETIPANVEGYRARGMRVVTNAGGVNPHAAAALIGQAGARVAVVDGDDLTARYGDVGVTPSGVPLSVNAYLGARPIAAALAAGADVVVTGRVVDSALVLGPIIHEFGWGPGDHDLLSAGSLAGHLLECGPQSTGGLLTDWEDTPSWSNPGFPMAQVGSDGRFTLTAPEESDALVDDRTVSEQLLYEIGDPARYILPDVVCDWTEVEIAVTGPNLVAVHGARGNPPPPTLKACAQVPDGWRTQFLLFVGGRDAVAKARRVGDDLLRRGRRMLASAGMGDFRSVDIEVLGGEDTYGTHAMAQHSREVVLKISVHHDERDAVQTFIREVPSIALAGPPGVSGGGSGLPRVTPLIRLECFPVDRSLVPAAVHIDGASVEFVDVEPDNCDPPSSRPDLIPLISAPEGPTVEIPLVAVAHGRSGDKGADVNIGIRARHPDFLPLLDQLTSERVGHWLEHLGAGSVERYRLPGINAVNLVLTGGLGSGGTASLRFDPQGKAVAQQLLDMPVSIPVEMLDHPALRVVPEVLRVRARER